jgi:murein DD-endopeptidase MepM/ murein hydrolase activator NlpD
MSVVAILTRAVLAPGLLFAGAPSPHCSAIFQRPVVGIVVDPYRPPACRWCPGNRGIDYATSPGDPVRAAARGVVAFAGPVAGRLVIVVNHPDGLRTTYDGVAAVATAVGVLVDADDVIGTAGDRLHFGVRRGDTYLDPSPFLAISCPRARLVPLHTWQPHGSPG